MRYQENIEKLVKSFYASKRSVVKTTTVLDEKILNNALLGQKTPKMTQSADIELGVWRIIIKSKASKFVAAMIVVCVVVSFFAFESLTSPTWALEQSIEALKDYGAVHLVLVGDFPGGKTEIWMRANKSRSYSTDVVIKGGHGAITWTRDGSTYHYEPGQNMVYFEEALTIGMAQWFGPKLLELLASAENVKVIHGKDPATGRGRVIMMCSMIDVYGPQSWIIEFDVATKLPVAYKHWQNLDRSGPPSFEAFQVTYHETLPDSIFEVRIPGDPKYVEKELKIPDETLEGMNNPQDGISAEGMTQQEAAGKVVRMLYQAAIDQDLDGLKSICPLCRNWGDEFLRKTIFRPDKDDRITEIVEIGQISKVGHSRLGTIVAVPTVYRQANGTRVAEKMIVQFRQLGSESSCVVHGPYGLPRELE